MSRSALIVWLLCAAPAAAQTPPAQTPPQTLPPVAVPQGAPASPAAGVPEKLAFDEAIHRAISRNP